MIRGATVIVKCKRCKDPFKARVADRKRGWGKFCSKSCKAVEQTARTGRGKPEYESHTDAQYDGGHFVLFADYMDDI